MTSHTDDERLTRSERRRRSQAAILSAARHQFGECGYERTTIRSVAALAGVDPGLVMQHFTSKEGLFAAATRSEVQAEHVMGASSDQLPHAALQDVFEQFEDLENRAAAVALMRNCLTHPQATAIVRNEVMNDAISATSSLMGPDEAELRSALFNACVMGLILARYVIQVEPLAGVDKADVERLLEPALRALIDTKSP